MLSTHRVLLACTFVLTYGPLPRSVRASDIIGKHALFAEYRRHHTSCTVFGSTAVPFSIGFRF